MVKVLVISNWWEEEDSYVNTKVINAFIKRGADVSFINLTNAYVSNNTFIHNGVEIAKPDLAVFTNTVPTYEKEKMEFIKSWNIVTVNEPIAHMKSSNKWLTYNQLINAQVPIPKTMPYSYGFESTDENIDNIFGAMLGWPMLVKTNYTGYGIGVTLCNNPAEVRAAVSDNWSGLNWYTGTSYEPISIQEYVSYSAGIMVSPWVQGDNIHCTMRIGDVNKPRFKSDILPGRTRIPIKVDDDLRKICMDTLEATGLEMARLDIMLTEDGYKVCEVNAPGGFSAYDKPARGDIGQHMADYCLNKLKGV